MINNYKRYEIFGIPISAITLECIFTEVRNSLQEHRKMTIGYSNIHGMNLAWEDPSFKNAFSVFDIIFCDGFGLKFGASLLGYNLPGRFTPPDFIHALMNVIHEEKGGVFLLGSESGVAEKAARKLKNVTPGLTIAGTHHGYFEKEKGSTENSEVVKMINDSSPSLLIVGFGMPLQEQWVFENRNDLHVDVVIVVGAMFDTLSGQLPRAPRIITDNGLEWLSRLLIEPKRLWRRYLVGNPLFFMRILGEKWKK